MVQNKTQKFESFVNSERYKTLYPLLRIIECLRALLIQKDTKLHILCQTLLDSLRALLIQKDTKRGLSGNAYDFGLRALLIQKDTKRICLTWN